MGKRSSGLVRPLTIRTDPSLAHLPVILLWPPQADSRYMPWNWCDLAKDACTYISKPFNPVELWAPVDDPQPGGSHRTGRFVPFRLAPVKSAAVRSAPSNFCISEETVRSVGKKETGRRQEISVGGRTLNYRAWKIQNRPDAAEYLPGSISGGPSTHDPLIDGRRQPTQYAGELLCSTGIL